MCHMHGQWYCCAGQAQTLSNELPKPWNFDLQKVKMLMYGIVVCQLWIQLKNIPLFHTFWMVDDH
jgi:hypothetical protein